MTKKIYLIILIIFTSLSAMGQKYNIYGVGFYNVENLFDTELDETINDVDFTPQGSYNWTPYKYRKKLSNLAFVINQIGNKYLPNGLAILGVSEVENRTVLEDLVNTAPLKDRNWQIVHQDSPDWRGIDVALLYDPQQFTVTSYESIPYNDPDTTFKTRDHLLVNGILAGEPVHVIVNHWPSRRGGQASSGKREWGAANCKRISDSICAVNPNANVIIMGDFNDDPTDRSTRVVLDAKKRIKDVKDCGLFNTMWDFYDRGIGSIGYKGQWNLFDQIVISKSLLNKKEGKLEYWKAEIFNKEFLIQKEGKNKGYPLRTFRDNVFIDGYSDHFPTLIYLIKEIKK